MVNGDGGGSFRVMANSGTTGASFPLGVLRDDGERIREDSVSRDPAESSSIFVNVAFIFNRSSRSLRFDRGFSSKFVFIRIQ